MRELNASETNEVSGAGFWEWWVDYNQQMLDAEKLARFGTGGDSSGGPVDQNGVPTDGSNGEFAQP